MRSTTALNGFIENRGHSKEERKALNMDPAGSQEITHEYSTWEDESERTEQKTKPWAQSVGETGCWAGAEESVMVKVEIHRQQGRFCTGFLKQGLVYISKDSDSLLLSPKTKKHLLQPILPTSMSPSFGVLNSCYFPQRKKLSNTGLHMQGKPGFDILQNRHRYSHYRQIRSAL